MDRVALDSSVVLALLDPDDAHHRSAVAALRTARAQGLTPAISVLVLAECLVAAARLGTRPPQHLRRSLADAFGEARPIDARVAVRAAELRAKHRWLRMPDAFVLAGADVDGCARLLTADRRWLRVLPAVHLVGTSRRGSG